jgi:LmbE family N-acetylglucosaminyl deacetylase
MDTCPTIRSLGTILGVWAHPDDEAYLSAGLMAYARQNGNRVAVVTATRGESGTDDPTSRAPEPLIARRQVELRRCLSALDVQEHRYLGFADGSCSDIDPAVGRRAIVEVIREIQPATIVTFGPDGMTGHPDHLAVSSWTRAAWEATGRAARLWYATLTPAFHRRWGRLSGEVGLWSAEGPPTTECRDLAMELQLSGEVLHRKLIALSAHTSQTAGLIGAVGPERFRDWWSTESFRAA